MRAMAIERFGGPEELRLLDLPRPRPERDEIVIRVVAAGVDPIDGQIREGRLAGELPHRFPLIPGWECAGLVDELGAAATRFRKGDRVWACVRKPTLQWGCYAEFVTVAETCVAPMPRRLLYEEAASVPLAALGARQALDLLQAAAPQPRLVLRGASSGAGPFAVQLGLAAGAQVLATAPAADHGFVLELGAKRVIDERHENVEEISRQEFPGGADLVIHLQSRVDPEALRPGLAALRPGGRFVAFDRLDPPTVAAFPQVEAGRLWIEPDGKQLEQITAAFDGGTLRTHVHKIHPFTAAGEAQRQVAGEGVRGKVVLNL